jgi:hypothetical protein
MVPFSLLIHNLEEALTIQRALPRLQAAANEWAGRAILLPSAVQYRQALLLLTIAGFVLLLVARRWARWSYPVVVVQAVMTMNVATHVAGALLLGGYAPGLLTALVVQAPTSALLFHRVRADGWLSRTQWRLLPILAAVLHGPGLIGLLLWVRRA